MAAGSKGRDRSKVQRGWGGKEVERRLGRQGERKMVDASQPLVAVTGVSQPAGPVNAKGRPGWTGTGTVSPRIYPSFPCLH